MRLMKTILTVCVLLVATTASAQVLQPTNATITTNGDVVCWNVDKTIGSVAVRVYGTWTGTVAPTVRIGSTTSLTAPSAAVSAASMTANGIMTFINQGWSRVCMEATASMTGTVQFSAVAGLAPASGVSIGAVTQSGTWTVQPGNTANTNAWRMEGLFSADGATAGANRVPVLPAIAVSSAPSLTNGRNAALYTNTSGALFVAPSSGSFTVDAVLGTTTFTEATSTAPGLVFRTDTPASLVNTTNEATALSVNSKGALWTSTVDPCSSETKTTTPFSLTTDTVVISAVSAKKNYICAIAVVASAAEVVSITEGTGSVCATSEAALMGSTTDANGLSFGANGGLTIGSGVATVIGGITANVDTCLNVSGSNRVSGFITWVQR